MKLVPGKMYVVTKKIKIHTKPLVEIAVPQAGLFVKQTSSYLIFRGFRVRKSCVVSVAEEETANAD